MLILLLAYDTPLKIKVIWKTMFLFKTGDFQVPGLNFPECKLNYVRYSNGKFTFSKCIVFPIENKEIPLLS